MPSTSNLSLKKPEFRQEFRLGLVVYGGVSLAIYMNGVCREFYNAVRGRGIYKLIKALTDSEIIVDAISGTSAGGINGILLSYALTNSDEHEAVDFQNFAEVWRESGNINKLLRQPNSPNARQVESVLDGEGYYQSELTNAFQKAQKNKAPEQDWFSAFGELDLFVTGTDVLGRVYKVFDNTGQLIEVKDHRTVFLLKHREGRKQPFTSDILHQRALAKLCRITSCFPVAFPVVTVKLKLDENDPRTEFEASRSDPNYQDGDIDQLLTEWGQLTNRELPLESQTATANGWQLHFVDGGVLDNRPFSYTIREIYYRTAYRPVERRLFYIDPSPDQFLGSPKFRKMSRPTIWQAAIDSLIGMPRYESIANDLQEINDRNEKVRRYKFLRGTAERIAIQQADNQLNRNSGNHNSSEQESEPFQNPTSKKIPSPEQIYLRCRLVGLRDRILPCILKLDQITNPNNQNKQTLLEKAAQFLTKYVADPTEQENREELLHHLSREIRNLDIDYALRKHFYLLEEICQLMTDQNYAAEHIMLRELAQRLCQQVELLEVLSAALVGMLKLEAVSQGFYSLINQADSRAASRGDIYDYLLRLHRFILDADNLPNFQIEPRPINESEGSAKGKLYPPLTSDQLSSVLKQLRQQANQLQKTNLLDKNSSVIWQDKYEFVENSENNSDRYFSLLRKVEQASEALIKSESSNLRSDLKAVLLKRFQNFRRIDEAVYSYEYLSDIQAKELLEIVRISPNDAQRGFGKGRGLADKLAGDQLRAFGGFFKKSWRSNDILWGRLDGLNRIADALLTRDSLKNFTHFLDRQIAETPELQGSLEEKKVQYLNALVSESFPIATEPDKASIIHYLIKLVQPNTDLTDTELEDFLDQLVKLGHQDILKIDLGNVLEDAIVEQLEWNQQQVQSRKTLKKTLKNLHYKSVEIPQQGTEAQLDTLIQLNQILESLLTPALLKGAANVLAEQAKAYRKAANSRTAAASPASSTVQTDELRKNSKKTGEEERQYLDYLMQQSFSKSNQNDRQVLAQSLLRFAMTPSQITVDDLHEFLNRLLVAGRCEAFRSDANDQVIRAYTGINQQLEQMIEKLKPKYSPITGYFDRTITPFAAKELARNSVQAIASNNREEDYFRNVYQVGSEKLSEDIPPIILKSLAARTGLILRNILETPPTGDRLRGNAIYQIINQLLNVFYWSVQRRSPKSFQFTGTSRLTSTLLQLFLLISAIAVIGFAVSKLPFWLLVTITSLTVLVLLWILWQQLGKFFR